MSTSVASPADLRQRRLRLRPDARIPQILDAALLEFSARGYSATRVDDIAARAGLSKGGFYAHFASKAEVFDALVQRLLVPPRLDIEALLGAGSAGAVLGRLVQSLYDTLRAPGALATVGLMLAEGARHPALAARWRRETLLPMNEKLGQLLREGVARGLFRDSALVRQPWLLEAPAAFAMLRQIGPMCGEAPLPLDEAQAAHLALLCELLVPDAAPPPAAAARTRSTDRRRRTASGR